MSAQRRRLAAVPDTPRRWITYVRVSALMGRGGEDFHSPDLQLDSIRALMARTGGVEVDVVQDIDRTGRTFEREGFERIMTRAHAGEVDVVGVYDLSRFGRNTGESLRHIRELRELGVHVVSTVEQIDDSPEGQFMLGQFLGMAQLYSDQIGRRWQQVIERRARQGLWHGSNPPLGYRLEPGRGLEPDPLLERGVREAFRRYADGHLISHVARDLAALRGKPTAVSVVKRAFGNPVYVGRVGEHEGRHEALVDAETWERVQRRLAADTRTPSRRLAVSHSLVGLVVCDHCGYHLQLHAQPQRDPDGPRGGGRRPAEPVLQCRQRLLHGAEVCPGPGTPRQRDVEAAVLEALPTLIRDLRADPVRRAASQAARTRAGVDVGRLRRELGDTEAALARLAGDLARRVVSEQAYRLAAAELERDAEQLRARLEEAQQVAESPAPTKIARQASTLLEAWDVMTVPERNRALRLLLREVRIRRAEHYRQPVAERLEVVPIS